MAKKAAKAVPAPKKAVPWRWKAINDDYIWTAMEKTFACNATVGTGAERGLVRLAVPAWSSFGLKLAFGGKNTCFLAEIFLSGIGEYLNKNLNSILRVP